jgi:hypothetical protein
MYIYGGRLNKYQRNYLFLNMNYFRINKRKLCEVHFSVAYIRQSLAAYSDLRDVLLSVGVNLFFRKQVKPISRRFLLDNVNGPLQTYLL